MIVFLCTFCFILLILFAGAAVTAGVLTGRLVSKEKAREAAVQEIEQKNVVIVALQKQILQYEQFYARFASGPVEVSMPEEQVWAIAKATASLLHSASNEVVQ